MYGTPGAYSCVRRQTPFSGPCIVALTAVGGDADDYFDDLLLNLGGNLVAADKKAWFYKGWIRVCRPLSFLFQMPIGSRLYSSRVCQLRSRGWQYSIGYWAVSPPLVRAWENFVGFVGGSFGMSSSMFVILIASTLSQHFAGRGCRRCNSVCHQP